MLAAIVIWTYLAGLMYLYGWGITYLLRRCLPSENRHPPPAILTWLTGLAGVTSLASVLSLFIPLNLTANLIVFAGAVAILWAALKQNAYPIPALTVGRSTPLAIGVIAFTLLCVLENATHRPANPDSGIYHVQFMRWVENFPVVPGLANLYVPYGFNSSWLVAGGLFSFSFLNLLPFHLLPGLLVLVSFFHFAGGSTRLLRGNARISDWMGLGMLALGLEILSSEFSAPGTDLPVTIISMVVFLEWIRLAEAKVHGSLPHALISVLCVYCLTIKPSTLPILLAAAAGVIQIIQARRWKLLAGLAVVCILIVLPWLVRNVYLTGYLVFPFHEIDIFQADWKVPLSLSESTRHLITYLNRFRGTNVTEIMSWDFSTWVQAWYSIQPLPRLLMIWTALGMPFFYLFYLGFRWREREKLLAAWQPYTFPALVMYAGMLYWFLTSPLIRFVYGYLISALALTLLAPAVILSRKLTRPKNLTESFLPMVLDRLLTGFPAAALILLLCYQSLFLVRSFEPGTFTSRIILPADYIRLPSHPCQGYNMTLSCADFYGECWYDPFPCLPGLDDKIGQRGVNLKDGFFHRDLSDEK